MMRYDPLFHDVLAPCTILKYGYTTTATTSTVTRVTLTLTLTSWQLHLSQVHLHNEIQASIINLACRPWPCQAHLNLDQHVSTLKSSSWPRKNPGPCQVRFTRHIMWWNQLQCALFCANGAQVEHIQFLTSTSHTCLGQTSGAYSYTHCATKRHLNTHTVHGFAWQSPRWAFWQEWQEIKAGRRLPLECPALAFPASQNCRGHFLFVGWLVGCCSLLSPFKSQHALLVAAVSR